MNLINHVTGCVCGYEPNPGCVCDDKERLVRARAFQKKDVPPLTPDERIEIAEEADHCGKGDYRFDELLKLSDADLCHACIDSWVTMARKHGL